MHNLLKLIRFFCIYGFWRTTWKLLGRTRISFPNYSFKRISPDLGIVGCGQFAFATIGFFIFKKFGYRFKKCFDTNPLQSNSFAKFYKIKQSCSSFDQFLNDKDIKLAYVSSNHASHAKYAVELLRRDIDVYIEKPIVVTRDDLVNLLKEKNKSKGQIYVGYNRPFSPCIELFRDKLEKFGSGGFSINCHVNGHLIPSEHWYRLPTEGTRVCGNLGHWLDLSVHLLSLRGMPDLISISISVADNDEYDDNFVVNFSSDRKDIVSIMLTSRCEPFEGINETINIQYRNTICKIDDFRKIVIWQGDKVFKKTIWPKDVGHRNAILQPFNNATKRDFDEVILSTLLMLHVAEMVKNKQKSSKFSFSQQFTALMDEVEGS